MKRVKLDGKQINIYEDGSIRIPYKDMQLCLDPMDVVFLYNESKKALNERKADGKDTGRAGCLISSSLLGRMCS